MARIVTPSLANGRFLLEEQVGVGGTGSVYRAFDSKKNTYVAVKSLGRIDAETVRSFKSEFRDFQHLAHVNLVALDEFFSEGDDWYFTMELVDGEEILAHVRRPAVLASGSDSRVTPLAIEGHRSPSVLGGAYSRRDGGARSIGSLATTSRVTLRNVQYHGRFDEERFRPALRQLTAALHHLHKAGKVHCDVKSYNVLVCPNGRTVLLDFGVSVNLRDAKRLRAATPLYMAPELRHAPVTEAADWYSVGVLIYLALTGVAPWEGKFQALMAAKSVPPPHPHELSPEVPLALADLAMGLVAAHPEARFGHREVAAYLDSAPGGYKPSRSFAPLADPDELFIGRERELSVLEAAYDKLGSAEGPEVVYVRGESGIGKSALVHELVRKLGRSGHGEPVVLAGRVFEEEVVPYKSVDGIVDALAEYLRSISLDEVDRILPEAFGVVADAFPVLRNVAPVSHLPRVAVPDPIQRRSQMFAALKECLRRLGEQRPLVVTVDDFQWSDDDSLLLWNELLRGPGAPRLLLIATLRAERTESRRPSRIDRSGFSSRPIDPLPERPVPNQEVWMRPLSEDESRAYVEARVLGGEVGFDIPNPDDVVTEANGHPLFLDELLRYEGKNLGSGELNLDTVLRDRIVMLAGDVRRYLELVCLAAKPLPRSLLGRAAGLSHGDGLRALKMLRAARLVKTARTPGIEGDDWVDPFHYRIRDACLASLSDDARAVHHRAIAETLESDGKLDAEQLSVHWRYAEDRAKAAHYAERAGYQAFEALGFRKAAEFFQDALAFVEQPAERAVALREILARSLRNSGNGKAAADVLLELAVAEPAKGFERRCEAAELLLRSGHVDEGTRVAEQVMNDAGESYPVNDSRAFLALLFRSVRFRLRGTKWKERSAASLPAAELRSLDALRCFSVGLGPIYQLRAYACAAEYSHRALDAGEPVHVAKALATEALTAAAQGNAALAVKHSAEARRILASAGERASELAFVPAADALSLMMSGRWRDAADAGRRAQEWIRKTTTGAWGELAFAEESELWGLAMMGDFVSLVERQASMAHRAFDQQDLYAGFAARSGVPNLAWLVRDLPDRAISETESALTVWASRGFHLQHVFDTYARSQAWLYRGNPARAEECLTQNERRRESRRILVPEPIPSLLADLTLRVGVARSLAGGDIPLAETKATRKKLDRSPAPWVRGLLSLVDAGLGHARRDLVEATRSAERASVELADHRMSYLAQLALLYARHLRDGSVPDEDLPSGPHSVAQPRAMARLFVPGLGYPTRTTSGAFTKRSS